MRHFRHSIGHVKCKRQDELNSADPGMTVDGDDADMMETGEVEDLEGLGRGDDNIDVNEDDGEAGIADVGDDDDNDGGDDSANDSDRYARF